MKTVLLIGMGQFGQLLGENLLNMGNKVMIVDKDEDIVNSLANKFTGALICNCMNADNLEAMDVPSYDVCVVTIADDFQSSLEITSILKDLGAKYIIAKANTDIQRKFLLRIGADEVIYPNRDTAEKLSVKISSSKVFDYIELDSKFSIFEIAVPQKWVGKSILQVNPRAKFGMNILTIKKNNQCMPAPNAETVFEENDKLVVFGATEKILLFTNKQK